MSDKRGWVWMSRKFVLKEVYLEIPDYQDSDATNQINGFPLNYSSTSLVSLIGILMDDFELVVAEEYKFG